MNDVAPEMFEAIMKRFEYYKKNNRTIANCEKRLELKNASYKDAYFYATAVGECMADAFADVVTQDKLPEGHMYFNIAQRTVRPALEHAGELCGAYSVKVQEILNESAGIGLKPL